MSPLDYGVLSLYVASLAAVCFYFSSLQTDSSEYFLARRSLGSAPVGLSLMVVLASAVTYPALPAMAYEGGLKCWIVPAAIWVILPLMVLVVVPIYRGLELASIYEYLEHRFDSRVRFAACLVFLAWRLAWLGALVYLPCKAFLSAAGWEIHVGVMIVPLGVLATVYVFLGGMRGAIWTDAVHAGAMLAGVATVIVGVWTQLDGGPARVATLATGLGRMDPAELEFSWQSDWSFWAATPSWLLVFLSFYVADQFTAQRYLAARSINAACTSILVQAIGLTILFGGLIYAGVCLFAFYYDHPQQMDPAWVVNIDNKTRRPMTGKDGRPLLDPANPADAVTWESVERLVGEGRILQPNSKQPFTRADDLVDAETNAIQIEKLAMRRINTGRFRGEMVVAEGAPAEMLPRFVATRLSFGAAGVVLAALLAGAFSAFDAALASLSTLLVTEFFRGPGWGKRWLARRLGKSADELSDVDELRLARPLTLVLGSTVTCVAVALSLLSDAFAAIGTFSATLGAPLVALFLLGLLTRRATGTAALTALLCGSAAAVVLPTVNRLAATPESPTFAPAWVGLGSLALTFGLGYLLSFVIGRRQGNLELRGLVAGCGTPGVRSTDEAHPLITVPEERAIKWK